MSFQEGNPIQVFGDRADMGFEYGHKLVKALINKDTEKVEAIEREVREKFPGEVAEEIVKKARKKSEHFLQREALVAH